MTDPLSPKAHGFQPFILAERYIDIECEEPGYEGFSINVRMNLSNGERIALEHAINEQQAANKAEIEKRQFEIRECGRVSDEAKTANDLATIERMTARINAIVEESGEMVQRNERHTRGLIAPHIRRWNVYTTGLDGEPVAVAPPAVAGTEAFDAVDGAMMQWLVTTILGAYRGGKGLKPLQMSVAAKQGRGETPSGGGPKGTGTPSSRASRLNSRSPEA